MDGEIKKIFRRRWGEIRHGGFKKEKWSENRDKWFSRFSYRLNLSSPRTQKFEYN